MKLLLAVDIRKDHHERPVDLAAAWAERLGGTLDLAWVDPFGTWRPFTLDQKLTRMLEKEVERSRDRDRARLEDLLHRVPVARRGRSHPLAGDPIRTIPDLARAYDALLLGPGERLGDQIGVASVEGKLIRHAPCHVIVLRPSA